MMSSLWRFANLSRSGTRAIDPSRFMISQMTPAGYKPAMRARSTAASVWPARTSTPPGLDRSGNMWPGRARSDGCVTGSIAASTVAARSAAEMPVLVDAFASIDTVNAVSNRAVFSGTISGRSSCSSRSAVIGMQIRPRPCVAMKLIASGVIFSAAIVKSPSFSRSASSTTITIWPSRMASTADSIEAKGLLFAPLARVMDRLDDILPNYVAFDIDGIARAERREVGVRHRVRHHLEAGMGAVQPGDGERNAVNGKRAPQHEVSRELRRHIDCEAG